MPEIQLDKNNRSAYEQNKREMFDGMRAYHASEQQHKRDAINFFKTILTVSVGVNGALLGSLLTPDISISSLWQLSWLTTIVTGFVCFLICNSVNKKIESDNSVYKVFGEEYTRFCIILELNQPVNVAGTSVIAKNLDPNKPIGSGDGYKVTMSIITETAWSIFLISAVLSVVVTFAS